MKQSNELFHFETSREKKSFKETSAFYEIICIFWRDLFLGKLWKFIVGM